MAPAPLRSWAVTSIGRWVADRPTRCGRPSCWMCSSRSRLKAKCEPRLSRARAWISSTMTVCSPVSVCRLRSAVKYRYRLSGVVTRIVGGSLTIAARAPRSWCPRAHRDCDARYRKPELFSRFGDLGQGALQVLLYVDGQRFEGRYVGDPGLSLQVLPCLVSAVRLVDGHQEAGQCLAGARGGRYEHVRPGPHEWPAFGLGLSRPFGEAGREPGRDSRVQVEMGRRGLHGIH